MDFRADVLRANRDLALARGVPVVPEGFWLGLPIVMLLVVVLAGVASVFVPSPELALGQAVVRLPGVEHARIDRPGTMREVLVREGDAVIAEQILGTVSEPAMETDRRSARAALAGAMAVMLRDPRDPSARQDVGTRRLRLRELDEQLESLLVRAPVDGVVLAARVRSGTAVEPGDIAFTIGRAGGRPEVSATFIGPVAARIREGARIRLRFDGIDDVPLYFVVRSVAQEAIQPGDLHGRQEVPTEDQASSMVVVQGVLEGHASSHGLYDGMVARAEVMIRPRSLAEQMAESLGWRAPR